MAELNDQVIVPVVEVAVITLPVVTDSIDCSAALFDRMPAVVPVATTDCTDAVTVFE